MDDIQLSAPHLATTTQQDTAVIRLRIPRREMPQVMGPAMREVLEVVRAQGIGPTGPMFSHHFQLVPGEWDFEVGVPVRTPVTPTGRVVRSEIEAQDVVRSVYRGPYEGLATAWRTFEHAIAAANHATHVDFWERYLAGPDTSADPGDWQTELSRPVEI